jgi:hypothetical protein
LLTLEGATGVRYDGVVYLEVYDDDGPTRLNFMAYRVRQTGTRRSARSWPCFANAIAISRSNLAGPAG